MCPNPSVLAHLLRGGVLNTVLNISILLQVWVEGIRDATCNIGTPALAPLQCVSHISSGAPPLSFQRVTGCSGKQALTWLLGLKRVFSLSAARDQQLTLLCETGACLQKLLFLTDQKYNVP